MILNIILYWLGMGLFTLGMYAKDRHTYIVTIGDICIALLIGGIAWIIVLFGIIGICLKIGIVSLLEPIEKWGDKVLWTKN